MEADQGHLRRARQVQVVGGDRVGLLAVRRELAGAGQRLLPHQRRDADQREVLAAQQVQSVGVHRPLEHQQVRHQRVGAFPGDLAGPGEVRPAALFGQLHVIQRREAELRRGPHRPQDRVRRVVRPDRRALPRDGGGEQQQPLQLLRRLRELLTQRPELDIELGGLGSQLGPPGVVGLGEFLRRALPPRLGLVQFVLETAGGLVEVEYLVDVQVDALDPDGGLHRVRVLPYLSPVQHGCASVLIGVSLLVRRPGLATTKTLPAVHAPRRAVSACRGGRGYGGDAATKGGGSAADQSRLVRRPDRRAGPPSAAGVRGGRGVALRPGRGAALGGLGQPAPVPAGGGAGRPGQPGRDGRADRGVPARAPGRPCWPG